MSKQVYLHHSDKHDIKAGLFGSVFVFVDDGPSRVCHSRQEINGIVRFRQFIFEPFSGDRRSFLVQELSRVYAQNWMQTRLLISVLVLTLSGANSGAASMCAAYCMASEPLGSVAAHHHQMESQPGLTSISQHFRSRHYAASCAECPPDQGNSLNEKADCARLAQIQGLKEGFVSLNAPSGVAHVQLLDMPVRALALESAGERFSSLKAPNKIRSFNFASPLLRI
jgi:hypothetical protein